MSSRPRHPHLLAILLTLCLSPLALAQSAQNDPLKAPSSNDRTIFENDFVAVIHAHDSPNEKVSLPDHPGVATVSVSLSNPGEVGSATPGAFSISPAATATHSTENPSDFLLVELKHVSLTLPEPFRAPAPQTLSVDQDSLAFSAPGLQVERIVCNAPCPVNPTTSPSLLIALSPLQLIVGDSPQPVAFDTGAVRWLAPLDAPTLLLNASSPAHVLRIILPPATR